MAHRIRLADLNEAALADMDSICAVDPKVPGYYKQVWTLTRAADAMADGADVAPPSPPNTLEVELDSTDPGNLLELKSMVKTAKESFLEGTWDMDD